jgi:hypothetical protein
MLRCLCYFVWKRKFHNTIWFSGWNSETESKSRFQARCFKLKPAFSKQLNTRACARAHAHTHTHTTWPAVGAWPASYNHSARFTIDSSQITSSKKRISTILSRLRANATSGLTNYSLRQKQPISTREEWSTRWYFIKADLSATLTSRSQAHTLSDDRSKTLEHWNPLNSVGLTGRCGQHFPRVSHSNNKNIMKDFTGTTCL